MTYEINETHDPKARSWVESANGHPEFPLQNLPFGVIRHKGDKLVDAGRGGGYVAVAIGDQSLDLFQCQAAGLCKDAPLFNQESTFFSTLDNFLMHLGPEHCSELRRMIFSWLHTAASREVRNTVARCLLQRADVRMLVPARIGNYTDFYASIHHATNVGSMFRPDNPLLPNYKWVPIAYHGRASSIVVSGTPVKRPQGQTREDASQPPVFRPSRRLDYELEVGMLVGSPNRLGDPIPIERAEEHLFGLCLVNDWSARDIQSWEYQPLGPFLSKNFATTISPWVVTMEALAPFRVPPAPRPEGDPAPLPHLYSADDQAHGAIDLNLEVYLSSAKMREQVLEPVRLSRGDFREMYWTPAQMLTHHACNGCNLQPGDLLASGTVSGPTKESRGCMLELTWRGSEPITLPTGEQRRFLEDGDEVIFRGWCEREGFARIGFGDCRGTIVG